MNRPALRTASDRARLTAIVGGLLTVVSGGLLASSAGAQIADQIVIYTHVPEGVFHKPNLLRVDRRLRQLGLTPLAGEGAISLNSLAQPMSTHGSGTYSVPLDALFNKKVLRISSSGALLGSTPLGFNPVCTSAGLAEALFVLTRIPLTPAGPMYGLAMGGGILWESWAPVSPYTALHPDNLAVTTTGEVWIGGQGSGSCGCSWWHPILTRVDPATGSVVRVFEIEGNPSSDANLGNLVASPDGTMWALVTTPNNFVNTDGTTVLKQFVVPGGFNGATVAVWIDGNGDLLTVSPINDGSLGGNIVRFRASDGAVFATHHLGGIIGGFALTGAEDLIAIVAAGSVAEDGRRLVRLNLVTGQKSSVVIDPLHWNSNVPMGDPTGWIFANVVDRAGDNDGDGAPNGVETQTGSNPFDPASVPWGPRTYLSFTSQNAIILRYVDPDGILDPNGGLDLLSFSLIAEHPSFGSGEIFWDLAGLLTYVQFSRDFTEVTLTFGGISLPSHLKIELTASVRDKTGKRGWDWQITPPGEG